MNKKALVILGILFVLIVGTLGYLVISKYSSKSTANNPPSTGNSTTTPGTATNSGSGNSGSNGTASGQKGFVKVSSESVVSPVLYFGGNGIAYFTQDGKLMQSDLDESSSPAVLTRTHSLEIPAKANVQKIYWSKSSEDFIVEYNSGTSTSYSYFNTQTNSYTDWPTQIFSFDWLPQSNKILYTWVDNGKATLTVSDADTKNWKGIADMFKIDNMLSVSPDGLNVAFYQKNNAEAANSINLTTPDGKVWKTLVKEGYNYGILWSPDSKSFLFGKRDSNTQNYQLWHYDVLNGTVKNLGLFTTPEKAVWDAKSKYVYAAVPSDNGSGDTIFRIDPQSLDKKTFGPFANQQVSAQNLFFNKNGDKLFFKNGNDGNLYYLDIGK